MLMEQFAPGLVYEHRDGGMWVVLGMLPCGGHSWLCLSNGQTGKSTRMSTTQEYWDGYKPWDKKDRLMAYRTTNELAPGTSIVAKDPLTRVGSYVLLRHEPANGKKPASVVWLNLETAAEERMAAGRIDEVVWSIVEP